MSGDKGLELAKEIYIKALEKIDELCEPYKTVIDIDRTKLPEIDLIKSWDSDNYVNAIRHDRFCKMYNPHFRQLLHVGYKVASEMRDRFLSALKENEAEIALHVTENLWERHIKRLFL